MTHDQYRIDFYNVNYVLEIVYLDTPEEVTDFILKGRYRSLSVNESVGLVPGLVKAIREARELSMTKLAPLAKTSRDSLSLIEAGKQQPTLKLLDKLAKTLEMELRITFEIE